MNDTNTILMAVAVGEGALALGALWMWWKAEIRKKYWREDSAACRDLCSRVYFAKAEVHKRFADYITQKSLDARRADRAANQARARKGAATKRARVMDDPIMKEAAR